MRAAAFIGGAMAMAAAQTSFPTQFLGSWTGTNQQSWGQASPTDPNALECMPSGSSFSRAQSLNVSTTNMLFGALDAATQQVGVASFTVPPTAAQNYGFASYDPNTNILSIRNGGPNGTIQCHWAKISGSGSSKKMTIVTLGGQAFTNDWTLQCQPSSYAQFSNVETQPACIQVSSTNRAPVNSTILRQYE